MIGGLSKNATLFEASGSTDLKDDILRRPVPVAKQLLHKDRYSVLVAAWKPKRLFHSCGPLLSENSGAQKDQARN